MGLKECHRILAPGGILAFSAWQSVPWFAEYRIGVAKDPSLPPFPTDEELLRAFSSAPERWGEVDEVKQHLRSSGFANVEAVLMENVTMMKVAEVEAMLPYSFDMMVPRFWAEKFDRFRDPAKQAIVKHLKERYGDGPVEWRWVAVVACGKKE
jgi:SAM-dependent methyltransferase